MKIVIVTGGTFGIGAAITILLAQRGYKVVAFGLDAPQVSSVAQGSPLVLDVLKRESLSADILDADVSQAEDVQRVVAFTLEKYGRIDALVNNAAIGPLGTVVTTPEELWDKIIDVNLKGTYLCSRAVIPHMAKQGGGSIVNIGSGSGWGKPNMAAYAASKGGIFALSTSMAYDHFHEHIRVNVIVPGGGGIVTGMSLGRVGGDPRKVGRNAAGTVSGVPATGEDIAKAVAFLLTDDASVISGTVIDVGCFSHQGGPAPLGPKATETT